MATVPATDFLILVDNLDGSRVYPVEHFIVDAIMARLVPVFDGGKTPRDRAWSSFTSFRLACPGSEYYAALQTLHNVQH